MSSVEILAEQPGADGPAVEKGALIRCYFTGSLEDGTVFDSARERAYECVVGSKKVIVGWSQGLTGMRAGGRRKFRVPAELAYGDRAIGTKIPPNSALIYDVELIEVRLRE